MLLLLASGSLLLASGSLLIASGSLLLASGSLLLESGRNNMNKSPATKQEYFNHISIFRMSFALKTIEHCLNTFML